MQSIGPRSSSGGIMTHDSNEIHDGQFTPLGVAGRALGLSQARMRQYMLADRVRVIHDSLGRAYVTDEEMRRLIRENVGTEHVDRLARERLLERLERNLP